LEKLTPLKHACYSLPKLEQTEAEL